MLYDTAVWVQFAIPLDTTSISERTVYFKDETVSDHPMREAWGSCPTIINVDDETGEAKLFVYML